MGCISCRPGPGLRPPTVTILNKFLGVAKQESCPHPTMSLEASKRALAKATARDLEDFKKWLGTYYSFHLLVFRPSRSHAHLILTQWPRKHLFLLLKMQPNGQFRSSGILIGWKGVKNSIMRWAWVVPVPSPQWPHLGQITLQTGKLLSSIPNLKYS